MEGRQIGMGEAISASFATFREHLAVSLAAIAAITTGYTLLDLSGVLAANTIATIAVSVFGQYIFTELLLADRMPAPLPARRYGALFIASILTGLGILVGMVLLLLPGLFLIARWSIASPFVVAGGLSGTEAIAASWRATARSWPALLGVAAVALVAFVLPLFAVMLFAESQGLDELSLPVLLPTNLLVAGVTVLAWIFAAAVYRALEADRSEVETVFS